MKIYSSITYYLLSFSENFNLKVTLWLMMGWLPMVSQLLIGEAIPWLIGLLVIYCFDFMLGVWIALNKGTFSPDRLIKGIYKFILFGVAIVIGNQVDLVLSELVNVVRLEDFHFFLAKFWIIWYMSIHESISALGKLYSIGVPLPKTLIDKLLGYKKMLDDDGNFINKSDQWNTE